MLHRTLPSGCGDILRRQCRESKQAFSAALAFTLGLALATSVFGMMAAFAGRIIVTDRWFRYAIAMVPLAMGVHPLGWRKMPLLNLALRIPGRRVASAFSAGFLLSLVIGPCSTPVFASPLSYAAYRQNTPYGAALLFVYGVGAGLPILCAGTAVGRIAQRLEGAGCGAWINRIAGASLLLLGFYLLWIA